MLWAIAAGLVATLGGLVIALAQGEIAPGGTIVITAAAVFAFSTVAGRRAARRHPRRAAA
jgi:ABC-type Mn2+/Zn2+ transport system permease subunit